MTIFMKRKQVFMFSVFCTIYYVIVKIASKYLWPIMFAHFLLNP